MKFLGETQEIDQTGYRDRELCETASEFLLQTDVYFIFPVDVGKFACLFIKSTAHCGQGPTNRLVISLPLVRRQRLRVVSVSCPAVVVGFVDQDYRYK